MEERAAYEDLGGSEHKQRKNRQKKKQGTFSKNVLFAWLSNTFSKDDGDRDSIAEEEERVYGNEMSINDQFSQRDSPLSRTNSVLKSRPSLQSLLHRSSMIQLNLAEGDELEPMATSIGEPLESDESNERLSSITTPPESAQASDESSTMELEPCGESSITTPPESV